MLRQVAEGVLIHESEFCQSNAVVVQGRDGVLLIDPGVQGSEMACLADDLGELGQTVVVTAIETLTAAETTNGFAPSGNSVATAVGCSDQTATCLRAVPADSLVAAQAGVVYPFVDGKLLSADARRGVCKRQVQSSPGDCGDQS